MAKKMKTNRGAAKRFKISSSGRVKRKCAYLRHGMRRRTAGAKRVLRKKTEVSKSDLASVDRLLPNG